MPTASVDMAPERVVKTHPTGPESARQGPRRTKKVHFWHACADMLPNRLCKTAKRVSMKIGNPKRQALLVWGFTLGQVVNAVAHQRRWRRSMSQRPVFGYLSSRACLDICADCWGNPGCSRRQSRQPARRDGRPCCSSWYDEIGQQKRSVISD